MKHKLVKKTVFMEIVETEQVKPEYWIAASQIELMEQIYCKMIKSRLNQADVARKLGVSRACVSRLLGGTSNVTLETIIKMALAVGFKRPVVKIGRERKRINKKESGRDEK